MTHTLKGLFIAGMAVLLTACGASNMALKDSDKADIKRITLIHAENPTAYVANDYGNIGLGLGAIGAAIVGSGAATKAEYITMVMQDAQFSFGDTLTQLVQDSLVKSGYEVTPTTVSHTPQWELLDDYSTVSADSSDVILDIALSNVGYATEHPLFSAYWRPSAEVFIALVDVKTQRVLMREKFMYGYHNPFLSGTDVEAPETYHFDSDEALFSDKGVMVDGMRNSAEILAKEISARLTK